MDWLIEWLYNFPNKAASAPYLGNTIQGKFAFTVGSEPFKQISMPDIITSLFSQIVVKNLAKVLQ